MAFMAKYPDIIDNMSGKRDYMKLGVRRNRHWATDIEIHAMASLLKTTIATFATYHSTWCWQLHKPVPSMSSPPYNMQVIYLDHTNSNEIDRFSNSFAQRS